MNSREQALLEQILAELRAIRAELSPRSERAPAARKHFIEEPPALAAARRHKRIRELAAGTGETKPWPAAVRVRAMLIGSEDPPEDCADACTALAMDSDCPRSERHIFRVLTDTTDETDVALCQWTPDK